MTRPLKRSLSLKGHKTSLSLEEEFWKALKEISITKGVSTSEIVANVDRTRGDNGLSSAVRIWILNYYKN